MHGCWHVNLFTPLCRHVGQRWRPHVLASPPRAAHNRIGPCACCDCCCPVCSASHLRPACFLLDGGRGGGGGAQEQVLFPMRNAVPGSRQQVLCQLWHGQVVSAACVWLGVPGDEGRDRAGCTVGKTGPGKEVVWWCLCTKSNGPGNVHCIRYSTKTDRDQNREGKPVCGEGSLAEGGVCRVARNVGAHGKRTGCYG